MTPFSIWWITFWSRWKKCNYQSESSKMVQICHNLIKKINKKKYKVAYSEQARRAATRRGDAEKGAASCNNSPKLFLSALTCLTGVWFNPVIACCPLVWPHASVINGAHVIRKVTSRAREIQIKSDVNARDSLGPVLAESGWGASSEWSVAEVKGQMAPT